MRYLVVLLALISVACAPLYPNNTPLEDAGEVALRVVLLPLTIGGYEYGRAMQYQEEKRRLAEEANEQRYWKWYNQLSPEKQDREDRRRMVEAQIDNQRRATALQGLFLSNQMMRNLPPVMLPQQPIGMMHPAPMPRSQPLDIQPAPQRSMNCISNQSGNQVTTNCY